MKTTIGAIKFKTKKAAGDAIRAVLYSYKPGETIKAMDAAFIRDVLARHPESDSKIGAGVESFQVQRNYATVGFWITRIDGSRTDFSFIACLSPPTKRQNVMAALKAEIRDQIALFRRAAFGSESEIKCEVTGEPITESNSHADHIRPFIQLAEEFLDLEGLTVDEVGVIPTADGKLFNALSDRVLAVKWHSYHRMCAELRMVTAAANMGLLRRKHD